MEERYDIRAKIAQGGLGAVYRAYDNRMSREVAIKRIMTSEEDAGLLEESTRQLIKEAGALASLQHPHIVTVYDVGSDEDGPYVVMELINGKTLDEIVEAAPLTWEDFRELALQSQEALIAAQELQLIHRDIKPGNLMLTWLPSGKFQIKIVDFGLAKLAPQPSLQTMDQSESVFGSVFFMAPEQFERSPIDARADMYAMGCVYYHALTGIYPFNGETGPQVMASHLQHTVTPLQEIREGIPLWACDWIMWHINRQPDDRPASARDALHIFLQNDKISNPPMSTGTPPPSENTPKRPRLIIPGATAETPSAPEIVPESGAITKPAKTQTAPQPLTPPEGSKPSVHTTPQPLPAAPEPEIPQLAPAPTAKPASTSPVLKPAGSPALKPATAPGQQTFASPTQNPTPTVKPTRKKTGLSTPVKTVIAAVLGILSIVLAVYLLKQSKKNAEAKIYNAMVQEAAKGDATEVPVDAQRLKMLLHAVTAPLQPNERQTLYKALFLAKATDGTDIDAEIAKFAIHQPMIADVREVLIRDVLRRRQNPSIVPTLLSYAKSTNDIRSATAALDASRFMVGDEEFEQFLEVIQFTPHGEIRRAAEAAVIEIIKKSNNSSRIEANLTTTYQGATNDDVRHSLLRLLGRCGGEKPLELVKSILESDDTKDRVAALTALGNWGNENAFPILMNFLLETPDGDLRSRAFDSAFRFATSTEFQRDAATREALWKQLASESKSQPEQDKIIRALAVNDQDDWVIALVEQIAKESEYDRVIDLAERALDRLRERARVREANRGTDDED